MNTYRFKVLVYSTLLCMLTLAMYIAREITGFGLGIFALVFSVAAAGFAFSWFNQDNEERQKITRWTVDILCLLIVIKLFFDCFSLGKDIFAESLKALVYFSALNSFLLVRKKGYYLILGLSLLLILFSAAISDINPNRFITYLIFFIVIWLFFSKGFELYESVALKAMPVVFLKEKGVIARQARKVAIACALVILLAIPMYFMIPRIKIPLPILPAMNKNRGVIFIDMLNASLTSFFLKDKESAPKEDSPGLSEAKPFQEARENLIQLGDKEASATFWHGLKAQRQDLEASRSQQKSLEEKMKNKEASAGGYDSLAKRMEEEIQEIKKRMLELQPDARSREELNQVLSERSELINKGIELQAKQELSEKEIEDFNNLKKEALEELAKEPSSAQGARLKSEVDKFEQVMAALGGSMDELRRQKEEIGQGMNKNDEGLDKMLKNSQDVPQAENLGGRLRQLEKGLQDARAKKEVAQKQMQDLSQQYMEVAKNLARKKEQLQEEKAKEQDEEKRQEPAGGPKSSPKEIDHSFFFESNPVFRKAASLILKLLLWLIALIILLMAVYLLCGLARFLYKAKMKQQELRRLMFFDQRRFIMELYGYLVGILGVYGYKRKGYMDAFEYLDSISQKAGYIGEPLRNISHWFLEARYSEHNIGKEEAGNFASCYKQIIASISRNSSFWDNLVLRIRFPFQDI